MRILIVEPGSAWSVQDVWTGIVGAFQRQGHEVHQYSLDSRLGQWARFLVTAWRKARKRVLDLVRPTMADILYLSSFWALEQALRHRVDWVLVVSALFFHPDVLEMIRRAGVRVVILFTESPYDDAQQIEYAQWADACWVNERTSVARFRQVNPNTFYWQHAMDPARHQRAAPADGGGDMPTANGTFAPAPDDGETAAHDVVFVGTGWPERCELLSAVDWTGIDLGLYGAWGLLGSRSRLRQYVRGKITPNEKTVALYRRAKIGVNLHRLSMGWGSKAPRITAAESINPRCYELAATGCFFVSDWRMELEEVFAGAVPTFKTPGEMERVIRQYLADDEGRRQRAAALPGLVAHQTFDERVKLMVGELEKIDRNVKICG